MKDYIAEVDVIGEDGSFKTSVFEFRADSDTTASLFVRSMFNRVEPCKAYMVRFIGERKPNG